MIASTPAPSQHSSASIVTAGVIPEFKRRTLLQWVAASAVLVGVGGNRAAGFFLGRSRNELIVTALPDEWVRRNGSQLKAYAQFIDSLRLEKITTMQLVEAHAKQHGAVWNTLPPAQLWKNIGRTLLVVDRLAKELREPVKEIISAYRSPAYNARCYGARSGSWHQANYAIDVSFDMRARNVTRAARSMRQTGVFRGGVGGYAGFTHIDTRGMNIDWGV